MSQDIYSDFRAFRFCFCLTQFLDVLWSLHLSNHLKCPQQLHVKQQHVCWLRWPVSGTLLSSVLWRSHLKTHDQWLQNEREYCPLGISVFVFVLIECCQGKQGHPFHWSHCHQRSRDQIINLSTDRREVVSFLYINASRTLSSCVNFTIIVYLKTLTLF
jgi:hypothetical protein